MFKLLSFLLLTLALLGCDGMSDSTNTPSESNSAIDTIRYGSFFGECIGYCTEELIVTADSIIRIKDNLWDDAVVPDTQRLVHNATTWDSLTTLVDNRFFALDSIIGCPDCADGGGEWLELVLQSGKKHRSTFGFGEAPVELKKITTYFRNLFVD